VTRSDRRAGRRRSRGAEHTGEGRDRWLISYADLATLLFALFVVLYAAADHERARNVVNAIAEQFGETMGPTSAEGGRGVLPGATSPAREAIDRALEESGALASRAQVNESERGVVVSLAEGGFFAPADAAVREDALPLLDAIGDALKDSTSLVRVEGHTDSTPISTARFPSNWELSGARAAAVLARLTARGVPPSRLSVAGYGGERPIADNATPEGRALNRRVDVVILNSAE
jgi:chemotaxis protein MotB